jgi:uncharacterized RDD family membrane protein YckC
VSYPPDPNNPYGQPQQPPYGMPQQQSPYAQPPGYGYPQQQAPGYGFPQQQPGMAMPYGYAPTPPPVLAGWGARLGGYLIDVLVVGLPAFIAFMVGTAMTVAASPTLDTSSCPTYDPSDPNAVPCIPTYTHPAGGMSAAGTAIILIGCAITLALGIWQLVNEGKTGQTLGKKAAGIRLVREHDGRPIGFGMAFVRKLAHILDNFLCGLGYFWPLWDDKSQCFADKVSGTLVIRA